MSSSKKLNLGRVRLIIFAAVTVLHLIIIFTVAIRTEAALKEAEAVAGVMKLVDIEEEPPPPPENPLPEVQPAIAENLIETLVTPPPVSASLYEPVSDLGENYLRSHLVSKLPVLPENEIVRATIYPAIAQRSNIEGTVFLELFIDSQGNIRDVRILRETPTGRGFGEAAVNAFKGIRGKPAEANGQAVAVRFRYNINFKLN